ncbi:MAG TPA: exosortase family protein XrtF [Bacteroidia bacterium]|jgi:exosortase family protein XrtF|nr:exosortase family protein XrtF [Bacteroidia bacterium]
MKYPFLKNPLLRFFILFIVLYTAWYVLYEQLINPSGVLDSWVINSSVFSADHLLRLFGYTTFTTQAETIRVVGIDGTNGLWIGDPCDGITLFALFTAFMLAFPGPFKHKAWFIPCGILSIFLINILRITGLCMIVRYKPGWLALNHDYIFKLFVYGFIFMLWMIWVNRFSPFQKLKSVS